MRLERAFRLLDHVTLAAAGVCLIYAEQPFLPSLPVCLVPFFGLVLAASRAQGRWVLPAWAANLLGLFIGAATTWWLVLQLRTPGVWTFETPVPVSLVPHLGPLLMALLLVKLFRPRGRNDFWLLQGIGLLQVGLGCVLASGPWFGALLLVYLACALACLTLHYHYWGQREARPSDCGLPIADCGLQDNPQSAIRNPQSPLPFAWLLVPFSVRWTLAVSALALALFLLTPRRDGPEWDPLHQFSAPRGEPASAQTGFNTEIDLNHTGTLAVDDAVAFKVTATDARGQPKPDLPPDQRFRGTVLDHYDQGVWRTTLRLPLAHVAEQSGLPDLGPRQFFLTFTVKPRRAGGLFLADPIQLGPPGSRLPAVPLSAPSGRRRPLLFFEFAGTVLPAFLFGRQEYRYRQALAPPANPERLPARGLDENLDYWYLEQLTYQRVEGLEEWTARLLQRLAAAGRHGLSRRNLPPVREGPGHGFLLLPDQWEAVARGLTDYLAHSPEEFTYTLEQRRQDPTLDPVMDFLCNVKQGHCERYATALTLMLRSQGIPARVVKGFRGAEHAGNGTYLVRQSHAHAWVEILVPRPRHSPPAFDWLTLDPTPAGEAPPPESSSLLHWLQTTRRSGKFLWQDLILDYNAAHQTELWEGLTTAGDLGGLRNRARAVLPAALAALAVLSGAALWLLRGVRRPGSGVSKEGAARVPFYARLVALLTRHTPLRPGPAQTPREFGAAARKVLAATPATAALADLPARAADLFYRVRFGGRPLDDEESRALDAQLDRLEAALRRATS